jgi:hypothetical protein
MMKNKCHWPGTRIVVFCHKPLCLKTGICSGLSNIILIFF